MKRQTNEAHGNTTLLRDGTWQHHHNTTAHTDAIKITNRERFTDTIHFNHKKLTRPTIIHANKVMAEIADCAKAIKTLGNGNGGKEM